MCARNLAFASLAVASLAVSAPARAADDVSPRDLAVMISSVALFVQTNCPGLRVVNAEYRRVTDQLDFDPVTMSNSEAGEVARTVKIFAAQRDSCAVVYRSAADGPMKDMIRKR